MSKWWTLPLAALLLTGPIGCQGLAPPRFFQPATAQYQQAQAERFDPYPENETGPPVVGARPQGFENPLPEVLRTKDRRDRWNWG
ncbi:MAG: hypothetical protein A2V70_13450, partial [Planctomycetes bacterium RBG_13_63_9]